MLLKSLETVNFRCLRKGRFDFSAGLNLVKGLNGSGKTSLLEAVAYVSTPRSFRGSRDRDMVSWGAEGFFLRAEIERRGTTHRITVSVKAERKDVRIDDRRIGSFADLFSTFVVLAVGPDSDSLISGPPQEGRRFLDWALSLMSREYYQHLLSYRKALGQKNALLRRGGDRLSPWNREMEKHGSLLVREREGFVQALQEKLPAVSRKAITLRFRPSSAMEVGALDRVAKREIEMGYSATGPHRDLFGVMVEGRSAREFASQGEQRIANLAIILAARRVFEENLGESPVLVLDEPANVLDAEHLGRLLDSLIGQVIYTDVGDREARGRVINLG